MATHINLAIFLFIITIMSKANPSRSHDREQDLQMAIEEMQRANYFTFVMLLNMALADKSIPRTNITFLMPKDRSLSNLTMLRQSVSNFLLRHSIPSSLLFDHLQHIPSGSVIPTSLPDYMLEISNNGRRNFLLNNVKLVSINLCTSGFSIRCHGIDGVLSEASRMVNNNGNTSTSACWSTGSSGPVSIAPARSPQVSSYFDSAPAATPSPVGPQKSGSNSHRCVSNFGVLSLRFLVMCLVMSLTMGFSV